MNPKWHICLKKQPKLESLSDIMPPFIAIKYTSPNMHELCNMVGKEINTSNLLNDCDTFGRVLMHQMPGAAAIIITLGEHGVLLIERLMNNSHIFDPSMYSK